MYQARNHKCGDLILKDKKHGRIHYMSCIWFILALRFEGIFLLCTSVTALTTGHLTLMNDQEAHATGGWVNG
jgi:hypothetical protein